MSSKQFYPPSHPSRRVLVLSFPAWLSLPKRVTRWGWVVIAVIATNLLTLWYSQKGPVASSSSPSLAWWSSEEVEDLYLLDKASAVIAEPTIFAGKVREVAQQLEIPAEWLMAVMYAESRFDPAVVNRRGSRATGLIQFMPATAQDLGVSAAALAQMGAVAQMDYVYRYLS
ncbi:MAG: transglycosylase SLT domain-containing protein, partial [Bacteroidota bacterium]